MQALRRILADFHWARTWGATRAEAIRFALDMRRGIRVWRRDRVLSDPGEEV